MNKTSFGNKGKDKFGATYAQMLLSGEPMARRKSMNQKSQPKFKSRRKRVFGRKTEGSRIDHAASSMVEILKARSWKRHAIWGIGIAVLFPLAVMLLIAPPPIL